MKENANRADLLPRVAAPPTSPGGPAPPPSAAAGIEATRVDQPTGRLYHERAALPEGVGARKNVAQGLREDGKEGRKALPSSRLFPRLEHHTLTPRKCQDASSVRTIPDNVKREKGI